jgi:hypothetical protein
MMSGGYADIIRALQRLQDLKNAQILGPIAGLLGFELIQRNEPVRASASSKPPRITREREGDRSKDASTESLPKDFAASRPETIKTSDPVPPSWLVSAQELPSASSEERPLNRIEPLLHKNWLRAILVAALSTRYDRGEIDVDRVIDYFCSNQPPAQLPLRLVPGMQRGLHCWVDQGEAMLPFRRDQDDLLAWLPLVVGSDRLTVDFFRGLPRPDPMEQVMSRPILLLSALGYAAGRHFYEDALSSEWIELARQSRRSGSGHLIALVPYSVSRYPEALRREVLILSWDRSTSVQSVLHARAVLRA